MPKLVTTRYYMLQLTPKTEISAAAVLIAVPVAAAGAVVECS